MLSGSPEGDRVGDGWGAGGRSTGRVSLAKFRIGRRNSFTGDDGHRDRMSGVPSGGKK